MAYWSQHKSLYRRIEPTTWNAPAQDDRYRSIIHHVDDAFVLTLDQIFVRREKPIPKSSITLETESVEESTTQEKVIERERSSPYKVTGYLDSENMWYVFALNINRDLIGNLNDSQKVNSYRRPQPYNLNHIKLWSQNNLSIFYKFYSNNITMCNDKIKKLKSWPYTSIIFISIFGSAFQHL